MHKYNFQRPSNAKNVTTNAFPTIFQRQFQRPSNASNGVLFQKVPVPSKSARIRARHKPVRSFESARLLGGRLKHPNRLTITTTT